MPAVILGLGEYTIQNTRFWYFRAFAFSCRANNKNQQQTDVNLLCHRNFYQLSLAGPRECWLSTKVEHNRRTLCGGFAGAMVVWTLEISSFQYVVCISNNVCHEAVQGLLTFYFRIKSFCCFWTNSNVRRIY